MKTISELEAEVVELKAQEGHLWAKVQEQSRIVDKLTKPWCQMGRRISETEMRIKLLKEMEAAQCDHQWEIIGNANEPARGRCVKCGEEP